jgi:hypothetical protein
MKMKNQTTFKIFAAKSFIKSLKAQEKQQMSRSTFETSTESFDESSGECSDESFESS